MALITVCRDGEDLPAEDLEIPEQGPGVIAIRDVPRVDEAGVDHEHTDDGAQEQVSAEDAGRGNGDERGQEGECGVGYGVQELEPCGIVERGDGFAEELDKTHHKTGSNDGGEDGDEYVAEGFQHLLPDRHLGSGSCLDIFLGCGGRASDRQEFIVHFVDGAGADDELKLSVGLKQSLDTFYFFQLLGLDLVVVGNDQAKPGSTVCRGYYVFAAADEGRDLLRTLSVVESHKHISFTSLKTLKNIEF